MADSSTPDQPTVIVIDDEANIVAWPRVPSLFSALRHSDEGDVDISPSQRVDLPTFSAAEQRPGHNETA